MTESTFASLGLRDSLLRTITSLGYEAPTPIQERTIPVLLAGRDLIGQAQTGTGKTAAFALPILERIDPAKRETQALVLTPTRELAMQVAEAVHSYAHEMKDVVVLPVYGGAPIVHQLKRLERGVQIVVGTPGRLIDHLDRGSLRLDSIRMIVLDEADEMLKMGFLEDVERILAAAPPERQIALFSATMTAEVMRISKRHLANAERVEIEHKATTTPAIEQRFLIVSEGQKLEVLTQILELETRDAVLVFRRTKTGAAELAERLEGRGFPAEAMHGDMKQAERESVIRRLRAGNIEIVVATDVAARGLDVEQITHVINYDIPNDVEAYVHRIGRTGRAGRSGVATIFITPRERKMMREIERFTGTPIKPMKMPTSADVAAARIAQLKETLRKEMDRGDLDMYLQLVEQLVEEGPHDVAEIAAAAARLSSTTRPLAVPVPEAETAPRARTHPSDRGSAPEASEERVRLAMAVGKRDGIRPADVVGSIANEADIPGRDIGPIDIRDDVTFVTIPANHLEVVLEKVGRARFRGRAVNLRVAKPYEGSEPYEGSKSYEGAKPYEGGKPYERKKPYERSKPYEGTQSGRPQSARPQREFAKSPARHDERGGTSAARPQRELRPKSPVRHEERGGTPTRPQRESPPKFYEKLGGRKFAGPKRDDRGPAKGKGRPR